MPNTQLFTPAQRDLLVQVFNRIIPAEGNMPGAGDLGLPDSLEEGVGRSKEGTRQFLDGLAQIDITAVKLKGTEFSGLSASDQDAAMETLEKEHTAFFNELKRHCFNCYYTHPQVQELIGYHRPEPHEYQPRPFDESLLEPQKQKAPIWRQV